MALSMCKKSCLASSIFTVWNIRVKLHKMIEATTALFRCRSFVLLSYLPLSCGYLCSAQSRNRYNSGIVLHKVGILTLLHKVGILTLRKTIPELFLRKVGILTLRKTIPELFLRKVGILSLRKTIPELSLRKVRIGTK